MDSHEQPGASSLGLSKKAEAQVSEKHKSERVIDKPPPEGVQRMEAITFVWSTWSLGAAYVGLVCSAWIGIT